MRLFERTLPAIAALTALLTGHAQAATSQQGSVDVGGVQRTYELRLPAGFDPAKRYPVVVLLHGGGGTGERVIEQSGLGSEIDRRGLLVALPDAGERQWNDGRETTRSGGNDVAFLTALVRQIVAKSGADPQRVFVAGVSSGGMMAQRLACETDMFAGVAVVAANLPAALAKTCRPKKPTPMMFFSGTADPIMPWAGGEIKTGRNRGVGGSVISTPETIDFWAKANGCSNEQTKNLPDNAEDDTRVEQHRFASCSGAPVILYEIEGGGHAWPGGQGPKRPLVRYMLGSTSQDIRATPAMLDFFGL